MRAFFIVTLIVLAGCRPPSPGEADAATPAAGGMRVSLELTGEPAVGPAAVRVYLLSDSNDALTDAAVTVTGTMTHAGMEPVIAEATATENGLYQTEDFAFTMAGDWILQAEVTLPDGGEAGDELSVTVPGPGR